MHSAGELLHTH